MVGMDSTAVMVTRSFMTIFRLLEVAEASVSMVPFRILLYIFVTSMTYLFSMIISSGRSAFSGYSFTLSMRSSFSSTASLERRDVVE